MSRANRRSVTIPKKPEKDTHRDTSWSSSENDYEEVERSFKGAISKTQPPCRYPHPEGQLQNISAPSSVANAKFFNNNPESTQKQHQLRPGYPINQHQHEMTLAQIGYDSTSVSNWSGIQQPPKTDLFELLRQMIMSFEKTNVQIRIAEATFNCHMLVLQCYSEFFKNLNGEQQIVLPAEKVTPQAFHKVYEWMLTSQPIVQRQGILELFNAAQFLKMPGLVSQCWVCLDDDERFCEDAAFLLYIEARKLGQDEMIQQLMLSRVNKFFLSLVASKEFLEFDVDEFCGLLSSNSIGVNSETDVLMSAARWLESLWPHRMPHILQVMKCVRFGLMAPWQLVELKRNVDVSEIQRFIEPLPVQKMIDDALSFVTTKFWYNNNANTVQHFLERLDFDEPQDREWIIDPLWNNQFQEKNKMCLSYCSFTEYLGMIRMVGVDHWRSLVFSGINPNAVCQEQRLVSRWNGVVGEEGNEELMENDSLSAVTLQSLDE